MSQFKVMAAQDAAEIWIYGDVGGGMWGDGISSKQVADELEQIKNVKQLNVRINSSGGDVFEGVAIYNQLKRQRGSISVDIDGAALSIASIIAMAADPGELRMADNAFMMIHDPWSFTIGDSADHRKTAELLDSIKVQLVNTYSQRTGIDADEISQMMQGEKWMDAKEAENLGFIDSRVEERAVAAHVNERICRNMPDYIRHWQKVAEKEMRERSQRMREKLDKLMPSG